MRPLPCSGSVEACGPLRPVLLLLITLGAVAALSGSDQCETSTMISATCNMDSLTRRVILDQACIDQRVYTMISPLFSLQSSFRSEAPYDGDLADVADIKVCPNSFLMYYKHPNVPLIYYIQGRDRYLTQEELDSALFDFKLVPILFQSFYNNQIGTLQYFAHQSTEKGSISANYFEAASSMLPAAICARQMEWPLFENPKNEYHYFNSPSVCRGRRGCIGKPLVVKNGNETYISIDLSYPEYVNAEIQGFTGTSFDISATFSLFAEQNPTQNGFYLITTRNGEVVMIGQRGASVLFGVNKSITELVQAGYSLKSAVPAFSVISTGLKEELTILTINTTADIYTVIISAPIRDVFYLIAFAPMKDIEVNGRWTTSPSSLVFRYATGDLTSNTSLVLTNNANYVAEFEIPISEAYEVSPRSGFLQPGEKVIITVSAYMTIASLPALVVNSIEEDTATCFAYLALNVLKELADCRVIDYQPFVSSCKGVYHSVTYEWSNADCFGGVELPTSSKCFPTPFLGEAFVFPSLIDFLSHPALIAVYSLLLVVIIAEAAYSLLLISKSGKTIEIVQRTRPVIYALIEAGLCGSFLFEIILSTLDSNRSDCIGLHTLSNFFMNLAASSICCATIHHFLVHCIRKLVTSSDYAFTLKIVVPIMVVGIAISVGSIQNKEVIQFTIPLEGHEITVSRCGRTIFLSILDYLVVVVCSLVICYLVFQLEKANVGREIRLFDRAALTYAASQIAASVLSIYFAETEGSIQIYLKLSIYGVFYILCNLFFGSYTFIKKTNRTTENDSERVIELFENPIQRACLRLHLRELMQERYMIFYDKLMEFRADTIHLAKPNVIGDRRIKSKATNLAGAFEMNQFAHNIYDEYMRKNAINRIPIDDQILKDVKDNLSEVHPFIFDPTVIDLRERVAKEFLPSYGLSSHSKRAKQLTEWHEIYAAMSEPMKIAVQSKLDLNSTHDMVIRVTSTQNSSARISKSSKFFGPQKSSTDKPLSFNRTGGTLPASEFEDPLSPGRNPISPSMRTKTTIIQNSSNPVVPAATVPESKGQDGGPPASAAASSEVKKTPPIINSHISGVQSDMRITSFNSLESPTVSTPEKSDTTKKLDAATASTQTLTKKAGTDLHLPVIESALATSSSSSNPSGEDLTKSEPSNHNSSGSIEEHKSSGTPPQSLTPESNSASKSGSDRAVQQQQQHQPAGSKSPSPLGPEPVSEGEPEDGALSGKTPSKDCVEPESNAAAQSSAAHEASAPPTVTVNFEDSDTSDDDGIDPTSVAVSLPSKSTKRPQTALPRAAADRVALNVESAREESGAYSKLGVSTSPSKNRDGDHGSILDVPQIDFNMTNRSTNSYYSETEEEKLQDKPVRPVQALTSGDRPPRPQSAMPTRSLPSKDYAASSDVQELDLNESTDEDGSGDSDDLV